MSTTVGRNDEDQESAQEAYRLRVWLDWEPIVLTLAGQPSQKQFDGRRMLTFQRLCCPLTEYLLALKTYAQNKDAPTPSYIAVVSPQVNCTWNGLLTTNSEVLERTVRSKHDYHLLRGYSKHTTSQIRTCGIPGPWDSKIL